MMPSLLFLIGYRGSGKTTLARLLAEKLGWQWLDADAVLEARFGRTIRAIFAEEGEAGFREKEAAVLADLCRLQNHVIATGGGIVMRPENRELMQKTGLIVWLTADSQTLWERMQADSSAGQRRPDLSCGGLAEIEQLLKVRQPLYAACANLTVDTSAREPLEVVDEILQKLDLRK
jgi:shikimate kinase